MRLIDADKLKVAHGVFCPRVEGTKEIYAMPADAVFADEIESAPTVDAIPVEFIRERIEKLDELTDYELNELGELGSAFYGKCALGELLEKWAERKEE